MVSISYSVYMYMYTAVRTSSSNTACSLPLPDAMAVRTVLLPPALPAPHCSMSCVSERVRTQGDESDDSSSSSASERDVLAEPAKQVAGGKKKRAPCTAEQKASRKGAARQAFVQESKIPQSP